MAKCTFWYWLTQVVPDKVHRAINGCVVLCVFFYRLSESGMDPMHFSQLEKLIPVL